jgi:tetratricopeptide (TPR) repeat protein
MGENPPHGPPRAPRRLTILVVSALLAAATLALFGRTVGHDFVNLDDNQYVYENRQVTDGLTWHGLRWAFTSSHSANWHPLTWLSHMLDWQLFHKMLHVGAGGDHAINVLLHAAAAVLLLLALLEMTGRLWPSAWVAAVFAFHPLRVESVAWIAERKDVLSGVLFMLTLWAYAAYARRPPSWRRYAAVLVLFALGLMAKPMLVTLPFVLLLLDYWPLQRLAPPEPQQANAAGVKGTVPFSRPGTTPSVVAAKIGTVPWLLLEKTPMLALAAISCVLTVWAQSQVNAFKDVPVQWRLNNAVVSYVQYLGQTFWPANLAVFYPHPAGKLPAAEVAAAALLLAAISAAALITARRHRYFLVGWLWYLGMLVPVIGLVQVGVQGRADRYTYLPQTGLAIAVAWGAAELTRNWRFQRLVCGGLAAATLLALASAAWVQADYWRDNETLWNHVLKATQDNDFAQNSLGNALVAAGNTDLAIACFREAVRINPDYAEARNNLGRCLILTGNFDEALQQLQQAVHDDPRNIEAHVNLGWVLNQKGRVNNAIAEFQRALQINPCHPEALHNLGALVGQQGDTLKAIELYEAALSCKPEYADAQRDLGLALAAQGKLDEALPHLLAAIDLEPGNAGNLNPIINWGRSTGGTSPAVLRVLAAAYAAAGRFAEAVETAEKALALVAPPETPLGREIRGQLQRYRAGKRR